jgi:hypothetical protein
MTPTYNHDLKGAVHTEEELCSHTHSIPKVNNTGYFWKEVITMGMNEKWFRQCINRGSTKSVNDTH